MFWWPAGILVNGFVWRDVMWGDLSANYHTGTISLVSTPPVPGTQMHSVCVCVCLFTCILLHIGLCFVIVFNSLCEWFLSVCACCPLVVLRVVHAWMWVNLPARVPWGNSSPRLPRSDYLSHPNLLRLLQSVRSTVRKRSKVSKQHYATFFCLKIMVSRTFLRFIDLYQDERRRCHWHSAPRWPARGL